jgi:hypothetical protein
LYFSILGSPLVPDRYPLLQPREMLFVCHCLILLYPPQLKQSIGRT